MADPIVPNQYIFNHQIIKKSDPSQTEAYDCTYSPYIKHRDGTGKKSQWVNAITQDVEFELFKKTLENEWVRVEKFKYKKKEYKRLLSPNGRGWGLNIINNKLTELGTLKDRKTKVCVCIFEEGNPKLWHGYPADFKKQQDRPLDHILDKWRDAKYINKAMMLKIKGGRITTV